MKPIKEWLDFMFDHTVLVAKDDPNIDDFMKLHDAGLAQVHVVEGVGCEMFAKIIFDKATQIVNDMKSGVNARYPINPAVRLKSVEVYEHGSNSAIYEE